jgi:hypothetical protein
MLINKGTQRVPGTFMNVPVENHLIHLAAAIIIAGSA